MTRLRDRQLVASRGRGQRRVSLETKWCARWLGIGAGAARRPRPDRRIGLSALVVLICVPALAGCGSIQRTAPAVKEAAVSLSTFPDSYVCHGADGGPGGGAHPEWVTYCPSTNLRVPAHAMVTFTIKQYDTGDRVPNPFGQIRGVVGGVVYVNGQSVREINPADVAHTFTVRPSPGEQGLPTINVPLPGVSEAAPNTELIAGHHYPKPNVVVFRLRTGAPGKYLWNCNMPCGGGKNGLGPPMFTPGYMAGTLTVT